MARRLMETVPVHTQSAQNQGTPNPSNPQHRIYNPVFCFITLSTFVESIPLYVCIKYPLCTLWILDRHFVFQKSCKSRLKIFQKNSPSPCAGGSFVFLGFFRNPVGRTVPYYLMTFGILHWLIQPVAP